MIKFKMYLHTNNDLFMSCVSLRQRKSLNVLFSDSTVRDCKKKMIVFLNNLQLECITGKKDQLNEFKNTVKYIRRVLRTKRFEATSDGSVEANYNKSWQNAYLLKGDRRYITVEMIDEEMFDLSL